MREQVSPLQRAYHEAWVAVQPRLGAKQTRLPSPILLKVRERAEREGKQSENKHAAEREAWQQRVSEGMKRAHAFLGTEGPIRVENILKVVAIESGYSLTDLKSRRRFAPLCLSRQIAMYLAKALTTRSYPEIGRRFGGLDHTTIMHGVHKIERLIATDSEIADRVAAIKGILESRSD